MIWVLLLTATGIYFNGTIPGLICTALSVIILVTKMTLAAREFEAQNENKAELPKPCSLHSWALDQDGIICSSCSTRPIKK
jgi:hypothetical protein